MTQGSFPPFQPPPPQRYPQYPPPPGPQAPYPGQPYPYGPPHEAYVPMPFRHSGVGIASVVLASLTVLGLVGTTVVAVVIASNNPGVFDDENAPATIGVGVCAMLCMLLSLVGVALGIGGIAQRDRRRVFPVIGLSVNAVILLMVLALIVVGAAAG